MAGSAPRGHHDLDGGEIRAGRSAMWIAAVAVAVTQASIVMTGAAVRLTDSGLGCDDWPTCTEDSLAPAWSFHGWVEFGNRLFAGVVLAAAVVALVLARRPHPRRNARMRWSGAIVAGTLLQAVVGGVTVINDLIPELVAIHFLLSMVLLWMSAELVLACSPRHRRRTAPFADRGSAVICAIAAAVLVAGTLVTGTGPNSGDAVADRLDFDLESITRVHTALVWLLVAAIVTTAVRTRGDLDRRAPLQRLMIATVVQGAVGYIQYALGLPAGVVALHIIGAMAVWWSAVWFHLAESAPVDGDRQPDTTLEMAA